MIKDDFGDRMKGYESKERFPSDLPVIIRIDGKRFSRWTNGLVKPYDTRLMNVMIEVTKHLVDETSACIGYTQSDEITLILYNENPDGDIYAGGKAQKLTSILASMTTAKFNQIVPMYFPHTMQLALFDARAYSVPSKVEATNALLWREMDATRNAVSSAAHSVFSHKSLQGCDVKRMLELLRTEADIDFNDYPDSFKRGTFLQRRTEFKTLSDDELYKIPKDKRPTGPVQRNAIMPISMPSFVTVSNRVGVVFDREDPIVQERE